MKTIKYIMLLLAFQHICGQNIHENWNNIYQHSITEKVYLQLNNVLYVPGETVFFKAYVTLADNSPTHLSDYLYVDLFDGGNKKIATQAYFVTYGSAAGSYIIPEDLASGLYKIRAYTKSQDLVSENIFEKKFFVQKVEPPRILMTLDFTKKAYGKGDIAAANFELRDLQSQPIKNFPFQYDIFIDGKKTDSLAARTDELGKAVISFKLPADLKSNDGMINLRVDYDHFQESVTRSIPIHLDFVDLQFLPESGHLVTNENSALYFIAKNEFGLPMDVAGYIEDEQGNHLADFKSLHDGMGRLTLTTRQGGKYFAVLTSPFPSEEKIPLPQPVTNAFVINAQHQPASVNLKIHAPLAVSATILIRNTSKIHQSVALDLAQGWNTIDLPTTGFPVGIQSFSLLVGDQIVAERLVFVNYQDGLKIDLKTDKETYLPREKVQVSIKTKNKNGQPVSSNLSVSVVDAKLLNYIDDKQDNILSWLFLGAELKGKIHEPRFYFDANKNMELRKGAIDMLLNTHGWKKFRQQDLERLQSEVKNMKPEKSNIIEGFVIDTNQKAAAVKVLFMTDNGKIYETKSNASGYFKFNRIHFSKLAYLAVESKKKQKYSIKNSFSDEAEFIKMKDTLSNNNSTGMYYKQVIRKDKTAATPQVIPISISLDDDKSNLSEVVVVGYGSINRSIANSSISLITTSYTPSINSLAGRLAGIQIISGSGQPGVADKVAIRGNASIYGNRSGGQPLIIIDGVPYTNNENASVLGNLSTNTIESVTILKDASAASIYGSAGANGVILVTTQSRYQGKILLGNQYNYTFKKISRTGTRSLNEADDFYAPKYTTKVVDEKTDFRSCIYWNATIQTNNNGEAHFEFYNSDDNTSFKIWAEGTSYKGDLGKSEITYAVKELIQTDVKLPMYASQGDQIAIPIWLKNNTENDLKLNYTAIFNNTQIPNDERLIDLKPNESKTVYMHMAPEQVGEDFPLEIQFTTDDYKTTLKKTLSVHAKGFPMHVAISGTQSQQQDFTVMDPLPNSITSGFKLIYNPYSSIFDGLEAMMREPNGCFEQVSSSNYPNIMAMQLLAFQDITPEFKEKAIGFLKTGYQKLKNYESRKGGFEWYGGNPGQEALTVYGLLQFHEMQEFISIDKDLVERSMKWLDSRKDQKGGFFQNPGKYGFSGVRYEVNNAYIVYVLSEIGSMDIDRQYNKALEEALNSRDLYRMELIALASFNLKNMVAYKQLMQLIKAEILKQGFKNLKAEQSVINSYGRSMHTEIAAFYALALLKQSAITPEVMKAMDFIHASKDRFGFGSTQATALALKAITEYTKITGKSTFHPDGRLRLNDNTVDVSIKDADGNVIRKDLPIQGGKNNFSFKINENSTIPYLFYVDYQTYLPNNSNECKLMLTTKTLNGKVKISATARVEIEVQNTAKHQVSNPIIRIGIPGGLTPEPWQLKELIEKNVVDYYEILGNELVFYFRKLDGNESRKIKIDLKAIVPGNYKGVASSAYLYYENEHKNWNEGISIEVLP